MYSKPVTIKSLCYTKEGFPLDCFLDRILENKKEIKFSFVLTLLCTIGSSFCLTFGVLAAKHILINHHFAIYLCPAGGGFLLTAFLFFVCFSVKVVNAYNFHYKKDLRVIDDRPWFETLLREIVEEEKAKWAFYKQSYCPYTEGFPKNIIENLCNSNCKDQYHVGDHQNCMEREFRILISGQQLDGLIDKYHLNVPKCNFNSLYRRATLPSGRSFLVRTSQNPPSSSEVQS